VEGGGRDDAQRTTQSREPGARARCQMQPGTAEVSGRWKEEDEGEEEGRRGSHGREERGEAEAEAETEAEARASG
jgi:hypothetical protein